MEIKAIHHTSTIEIKLRSDHIMEVHSLFDKKDLYTLSQMQENVAKLLEFKDEYSLILVFIKNGKYSREARNLLAEQDDLAEKVAMVAKTPYQRLVGNFFLGLYRPKLNIKLFDSGDKAVKWLLSD